MCARVFYKDSDGEREREREREYMYLETHLNNPYDNINTLLPYAVLAVVLHYRYIFIFIYYIPIICIYLIFHY